MLRMRHRMQEQYRNFPCCSEKHAKSERCSRATGWRLRDVIAVPQRVAGYAKAAVCAFKPDMISATRPATTYKIVVPTLGGTAELMRRCTEVAQGVRSYRRRHNRRCC